MESASSYLQPRLPLQLSQLLATLTKQEERIIELRQEDDGDEVGDLDRDEGKP
jgi:hypothetical protein